MNYKVSILLSTFNRAHLIEETLASIQNQTFSDWECIIVDDNSVDNTKEVIERFNERDSRFSYFLKSEKYGKGLSGSRNYGLDLAKKRGPDFIQFFDDDDLMHPTKLELQIENLQKNPTASFSLCGIQNFLRRDEINENILQEYKIEKNLNIGEAYLIGKIKFGALIPLFRYEFVKDFKFDEELFYAEEWVLFSQQFLFQKPKYSAVNKVLFYRRKHPESITEMTDKDYSRRKTSAITRIKIFEFLNKHYAHSRVTLLFFTKTFLINQYNKDYIIKMQDIIKTHPDITKFIMFKIRFAILVQHCGNKIVSKLLKV